VIGRLHHLVIDCPDPRGLAQFYSRLLGQPVTFAEDDFVVVSRDSHTSGLAFQLAPDLVPSSWPDPERPQQMHLDVMVDDIDEAEAAVLIIGARRLSEPGAGSRVFADPAGHPFCLIPRPVWAEPVGPVEP
jgi:catechol 2,3-dioxygenase-like lactoylglutathione lyase family enzyme